jgi:hypothetical protein
VTAVDRWLDRREIFRAVVLLSVVLRVLFVLAPFDVLAPIDPWDLGRALWRGEVPYRDFAIEYPPAGLLAFLVPGAMPHGWAPHALALQAFVLEASLVSLLRDDQAALRRYLLVSLFTTPLLSGGFDAVPVVAVAWSTSLLAGRRATGWWVAALGAAAKLFPGVAWGWCRRRPLAGAVALAVTVAVLLGPLLLADADRTPIGYHVDRGVQNESVAASATFLGDRLQGDDTRYDYRYRSNELVGAEGAGFVTLALFGAGAVAVAVACQRRQRDDQAHLRALALLLLALCASKVLSPQFVVLLTPLAAVVGGGLFLAYMPVAVLTLAAFMVDDRRSDSFVTVATIRNVLLVGMAVAASATVLRSASGPSRAVGPPG